MRSHDLRNALTHQTLSSCGFKRMDPCKSSLEWVVVILACVSSAGNMLLADNRMMCRLLRACHAVLTQAML